MLVSSACSSGFAGACYVDFPHKGLANKYFLCLKKTHSTAVQPLHPLGSVKPSVQGQGLYNQPLHACPLAFPLHCKLALAVHAPTQASQRLALQLAETIAPACDILAGTHML